MQRILVTGGIGFIGLNVVRQLIADNYQVDIIDNLSRGVLDSEAKELMAHRNVQIIKLDLVEDSLAHLDLDYSYIYHLAAIIGVQHVLKSPFKVLDANVQMLSKMLEFAKRQVNLKRFLFASTSEVNAGKLAEGTLPLPTPELMTFSIPDISQPRTSYLLSKIYGEAMCIHSGLPYVIFRPHNVYGPRMGMSHVIPELLNKIYLSEKNGQLPVYSLQHRRTFCYINDFVSMLIAAAKCNDALNQVINLGVENPEVTIAELAQKLLDVSGRSDLNIVDAGTITGSPERRCPDIAKVCRLTASSPQVSLDQGLQKTYEWYLNNVFTTAETFAI